MVVREVVGARVLQVRISSGNRGEKLRELGKKKEVEDDMSNTFAAS